MGSPLNLPELMILLTLKNPFLNSVTLTSTPDCRKPNTLLESFASGVPLVSTDVGMVHDIAKDGYNALISEVGDVRSLVRDSIRLIEDKNLAEKLIEGGSKAVNNFDWKIISRKYFEEIYSKLL